MEQSHVSPVATILYLKCPTRSITPASYKAMKNGPYLLAPHRVEKNSLMAISLSDMPLVSLIRDMLLPNNAQFDCMDRIYTPIWMACVLGSGGIALRCRRRYLRSV